MNLGFLCRSGEAYTSMQISGICRINHESMLSLAVSDQSEDTVLHHIDGSNCLSLRFTQQLIRSACHAH